jgi:hypothetical protein
MEYHDTADKDDLTAWKYGCVTVLPAAVRLSLFPDFYKQHSQNGKSDHDVKVI